MLLASDEASSGCKYEGLLLSIGVYSLSPPAESGIIMNAMSRIETNFITRLYHKSDDGISCGCLGAVLID